MKYIFSFFVLLSILSRHLSAGVPYELAQTDPYHVVIKERQFTFSTYYLLESDLGSLGNVIKTRLSLWTHYEYFNAQGELASYAYLRMFSLGMLFSWAGTMDIYDVNSHRIGLIEGAMLTLLPSKFSFYNADNDLVGIAYMDHDCMGFTVTDPVNEQKTIAYFHRVFIKDAPDHWTITVLDPTAIDMRLLMTFGAFAVDNQGDFREDN